jgi:hypothetical protein
MKRLAVILTALVFQLAPAFAGWLPREIGQVRAYVYDYTQERGNDALLKDGILHTGVINKGGAILNDDQVAALKAALKSSPVHEEGPMCYMPHHGFVFYDKKGRAMGHVELCFHCGEAKSSPKGFPNILVDWDAIRKILGELKVPVLDKDEDYTKLYLESKKAPAAKAKGS